MNHEQLIEMNQKLINFVNNESEFFCEFDLKPAAELLPKPLEVG